MMSWWFCVVFAWGAQSPQKDSKECQFDAKYNFWANKSERIPKQFSPISTFVRPPITTVETYVETYVELSLCESWPRVPELIWNLIERNHGEPNCAHIGNAQTVAPSGSTGRHIGGLQRDSREKRQEFVGYIQKRKKQLWTGFRDSPPHDFLQHLRAFYFSNSLLLVSVRFRIVVRPTFAGSLQDSLPNVAKKKYRGICDCLHII